MIEVRKLVKKYSDLTAVNNLDLSIKKGQFYGLLGPNGAGKTTTLKMLSMLLTPDSGEILIDGKIVNRKSRDVKTIIGVVPQHVSLQKETTVYETLVLHGLLHNMKFRVIKQRIDELLNFAEMSTMRNKKIETLSGGNKRKLMIIRSMLHKPSVLFLDEPTIGLDPAIRRVIWDLLKRLKTDGLTIILTTHYIEEANILCDVIGFMSRGSVVKEASPFEHMKGIKPVILENFNGNNTEYFYFDNREEASAAAVELDGEVHIRKTNLEDVYVSFTKDRRLE